MNQRRLQFRIGLMVLAATIAAAILVVQFGEGPELFRPHYTIYIKVRSAEGVSQKTAIRKRGIVIGRVAGVELLDGDVLLTADIDADYKIHRNEICRIYPSVLGDADVNFALPPGQPPSSELLTGGDTVTGEVKSDPMQMVGDMQGDFTAMIRSVTATTEETQRTLHRIATLFEDNEDRINHIIENVDANMSVVRETLQNANKLIGDAKIQEDIRNTVAEMPDLTRDARTTLARVKEMAESANKNLDSLSEFTLALQEKGIIEDLDRGAAQLRESLDNLRTFSYSLNRNDTSFGLLMHDRRLYDNINRTAVNLEELSRALRPVVNDARVFADKIARHPELLGVRGALKPSDGTKGVPSGVIPTYFR